MVRIIIFLLLIGAGRGRRGLDRRQTGDVALFGTAGGSDHAARGGAGPRPYVVAAMLLWASGRRCGAAGASAARPPRTRQARGRDAITQGLIAIGAGDSRRRASMPSGAAGTPRKIR